MRTPMLRSDLLHYSDTYIVGKEKKNISAANVKENEEAE